jgi:hypothetical protein
LLVFCSVSDPSSTAVITAACCIWPRNDQEMLQGKTWKRQ